MTPRIKLYNMENTDEILQGWYLMHGIQAWYWTDSYDAWYRTVTFSPGCAGPGKMSSDNHDPV